MRRPSGADFAPGAWVFPGGSVHTEDTSADDEIRAAAIRELFEEMGILLARGPDGFAKERDANRVRDLVGQGQTFRAALASAHLVPAPDRLVFLARWVTPVQLRRRFDARFFLARMPAGQAVHAQPGEVADWRWITPQAALTSSEVTLVYATRKVLESVATGETAATVIARARRRRDVSAVTPVLVRVATFAIDGVDPRQVSVEVDIRPGLPAFVIVTPAAHLRASVASIHNS